jgi:hypothetical protein
LGRRNIGASPTSASTERRAQLRRMSHLTQR